MSKAALRSWLIGGLGCLAGCASVERQAVNPTRWDGFQHPQISTVDLPATAGDALSSPAGKEAGGVQTASHVRPVARAQAGAQSRRPTAEAEAGDTAQTPAAFVSTALAAQVPASNSVEDTQPKPAAPAGLSDGLAIDLPLALSMVDGQHPAVGMASWQVQEAYARLDQARVLWLPTIQAGFSFHNHDGNYQASNGTIVDVHRNSFQYGLGAGATGAGTTPRPGIVAQFDMAEAWLGPGIAEKQAWARGHAANAVVNEQLLSVGLAYVQLLEAMQRLSITQETYALAGEVAKLTADFAASGQGLQADADRLQTELSLVEARMIQAKEDADVASASLAAALSIDASRRIIPADPNVVPLEFVSPELDKATLITTGLSNRPELRESQALVAAACQQYRRQQVAPFVPSVLLGFSTGGFGGGVGNSTGDFDQRYDLDALAVWQVRNLGLGERYQRREASARVQQARFEKLRVMDQVAREVSEAHAQVVHRAQRIQALEQAIQHAENSYARNLSRIRDGQGLPLEVLQSVQALDAARRAYLAAVVDYNASQLRLQWALGWTVTGQSSGG